LGCQSVLRPCVTLQLAASLCRPCASVFDARCTLVCTAQPACPEVTWVCTLRGCQSAAVACPSGFVCPSGPVCGNPTDTLVDPTIVQGTVVQPGFALQAGGMAAGYHDPTGGYYGGYDPYAAWQTGF
jgi:hypothetical protein